MEAHQAVKKLSSCCVLIAWLVSALGCQPSETVGGQFGSISLSVTHEDGSPYEGLVVRVAGSDRQAATDAQGKVRFEGLTVGARVSLVYSQQFMVQDREHQVVAGEMVLEDAASVSVPSGEVQLRAQVKAQARFGAGCNTTPWAIMGVTTGSDLAPFLAKGTVGKVGPCSCKGSATAPLNAPSCPGTTIFAAGTPPAAQVWAVNSDTCLGDAPGCEGPVRTATATVSE